MTTANEPVEPTVNVALPALVMPGASSTVNTNAWAAVVPTLLLDIKLMSYTPPVPADGVPERTPFEKVTPPGRVPVSEIAGAGKPVSVTVNVPVVPAMNVAAPALVIAGA